MAKKINLILGIIIFLLGLIGFFKFPIIFGDTRVMWILICIIGLIIIIFPKEKLENNKFKNKKGVKK